MRRLMCLVVLTGLFVLSAWAAGAAAQASEDPCFADGLATARVSASVKLRHDGEETTKAEAVLVVKVPKGWALASGLMLNGDSERYRTAMRCLLREPTVPHVERATEWRPGPPEVSVTEKWITVDYVATTHVDDQRERAVGPWSIHPGRRLWTLVLQRPPALDRAWWQTITVDLGGRAARSIQPMPTKGPATQLTWSRPKPGGKAPAVTVGIQPPAAKALAATWNEGPRYLAASVPWLAWSVLLPAVALALLRGLPPVQPASTAAPAAYAARRNLRLWVWGMSIAVFVFELDDQAPRVLGDLGVFAWWPDHRVAIQFVLAACTGAILCLFGRPRPAAWVVVALATAFPLVIAVVPEELGLPAGFWLSYENTADVERLRDAYGFFLLAVACWCVAFVWLVGTVSALLRLREAVRTTTAGEPPRGRFPWWVLIVCAASACLVVGYYIWARQNVWEQETWLSAHDASYPAWHLTRIYNDLAWFPSDWPDWFHTDVCWWYGLIGAVLAVLAVRCSEPGADTVTPGKTELLLLALIFVGEIAPTPGWYAGAPLWMVSLIPTGLAGYLLLAVGRRRAVLSQTFGAGEPSLRAVMRESDRSWLIESARKYRDLHSQLRRLEQGDQDGDRDDLESRLDELHTWNPADTVSGHAGKELPDMLDAVELALAWGPRDTWWNNACRAAFFAALVALPATAVSFWADNVRGPLWGDVARDEFGAAGLVDYVITSEVIWAVLGFVLGALWRVLPGRRGPAKALGLSLVYAAPVALHWGLSRVVGESVGTWVLDAALTLLILTTTGVAMDIDTFRREGNYWPTKASLLLSVYQLRTASVQLAFFVAQVVALVGVWQQLKGNDPMVLIQPQDPPGTSGTPESGGH
ncbi:DUF6185 family protein [Streptomyces sp. NPDC002588]|uniref:DUF6185 family protein n=1 Tax=Streptomyces sp. NPDC002588 TaxID=3154419 RepID=UPI003321B69A